MNNIFEIEVIAKDKSNIINSNEQMTREEFIAWVCDSNGFIDE